MVEPVMFNGLPMPEDFSSALFHRVTERAVLRSQTHVVSFEQFSMAWNAIPYRFLALADDSHKYTASIGAPDGASSSRQRYIQERHLFGFFSNGFSMFESFFYAMFAVGGMLSSADFPLEKEKEQRKISPPYTQSRYAGLFGNDPVLTAFDKVLNDAAYTECKDIRNILSHRTAPGRRVFLSTAQGKDIPSQWKIDDIPLDSELTISRRAQLAALLTTLLGAAAEFCETQIQ